MFVIAFCKMNIKDLTCEQCDKTFKYKQGLENHVKFVHDNIREFKCEFCDYEAHTGKSLNEHTNAVHLKQKYKCTICPKEYAYKHALAAHMRNRHDPNFKGHPCDKCEFLGQTQNILQHHKEKAHKSEKKVYQCENCDKSYTNRTS